ncbi:MAG: VWA domain-containing protein [Kofleriaceae bacterium]|nr:VWA domain-containing protein [Kofleriaceae bacterium]MBP6839375.1 VWA domain-containing protein [Kofleriaceae bacterium]MBP9207066.1 VWA domain-containing protein [Kofleriaceae bacterium]
MLTTSLRRLRLCSPALASLLLAAACGGPGGGGDGVDAGLATGCSTTGCPAGERCSAATDACIPDGTCAGNADCAAGMNCDLATHTCAGCGSQELPIEAVPPHVLLVLDRSCSMRQVPAGVTTTDTKWMSAVAAIGALTSTFADDVRWGLAMFPDSEGEHCAQAAPAVPIGPDTAPLIGDLLTSALATTDVNYPDFPCVTNIDTGMTQADALLSPLTGPEREYAMLITDGAQSANCDLGGGDLGSERVVAEMHARGIDTFVVGFGGSVDKVQLNKLAVAGGQARPGVTQYFDAATAAELQVALDAIARSVVSCSLRIDPAPADLGQTFVFFEDTEQVPRDPSHAAGWDYDPATMQLTLYGAYCDRLQDRTVADIDVVFGCPQPIVD